MWSVEVRGKRHGDSSLLLHSKGSRNQTQVTRQMRQAGTPTAALTHCRPHPLNHPTSLGSSNFVLLTMENDKKISK